MARSLNALPQLTRSPWQPGARGWLRYARRYPSVSGQLVCCECGDHPDLDYRDISPELSAGPRAVQVRGRHRGIRGAHQASAQAAASSRGSPNAPIKTIHARSGRFSGTDPNSPKAVTAGRCFLQTEGVMVLFTVARAAGLLGAPDMSTYLCAFSPWRCPPLIAWSAGATRADLGLGRTDVRAGLGYGAGAFGTAVAVWVLPSGGLWPAGRRAQLHRRARPDEPHDAGRGACAS